MKYEVDISASSSFSGVEYSIWTGDGSTKLYGWSSSNIFDITETGTLLAKVRDSQGCTDQSTFNIMSVSTPVEADFVSGVTYGFDYYGYGAKFSDDLAKGLHADYISSSPRITTGYISGLENTTDFEIYAESYNRPSLAFVARMISGNAILISYLNPYLKVYKASSATSRTTEINITKSLSSDKTKMRLRIVGSNLKIKVWQGDTEPSSWDIDSNITGIASSGAFGVWDAEGVVNGINWKLFGYQIL